MPGAELKAGYGCDAGQGLATKPQGGNGLQVPEIGDLAGGVPAQRQGQVIQSDSLAVVPDPQQLDTALLGLDLDTVGTGVQAILDQLLGHRSRPLHHLPRRNLVDELGGKLPDAVGHGAMEAKSGRVRKVGRAKDTDRPNTPGFSDSQVEAQSADRYSIRRDPASPCSNGFPTAQGYTMV